jgi:hypothetical protein
VIDQLRSVEQLPVKAPVSFVLGADYIVWYFMAGQPPWSGTGSDEVSPDEGKDDLEPQTGPKRFPLCLQGAICFSAPQKTAIPISVALHA